VERGPNFVTTVNDMLLAVVERSKRKKFKAQKLLSHLPYIHKWMAFFLDNPDNFGPWFSNGALHHFMRELSRALCVITDLVPWARADLVSTSAGAWLLLRFLEEKCMKKR
jgi:hypothetical protein